MLELTVVLMSSCTLQVAKFVSFVAGSFAALLLGLSFLDENLLEVPMAGRNLVWWLALTGILLTIRSVLSQLADGALHAFAPCWFCRTGPASALRRVKLQNSSNFCCVAC